MHVKVYNSITEIDEEKWNALIGRNRIICSFKFLLAVEKSHINDCEYYYPVVYENNQIIAHACTYSITTDLDTLAKGISKKIIQLIRFFWKNFLKIKFLECGTPIAIGNTISFAENIDKKKALNILVDCVEKIANNRRLNIILFRDFYEDEINFFNDLNKKKYKKVNNLPNAILKVKWNSFDEYINDLRSHYRYKFNKYLNKIKQEKIKVELCNDFIDIAENLQTLWQNVYDNAKEYKREILTKDFFIYLNSYLKNKAKIILLKKDLKIIGFALLLIDNDILRFMFSGIDYKYNIEHSTYFNSLLCIVNQAIIEQKKEIDIGLTTYIPKMNVGAKIVNLYMYIKHTNRLLNPLITNLFTIMNPKIEIKTNNVFKEKIENKFAKKYSLIHN
ncbi:MAG: GNAT family N-acetyltransferase [Spirochaetes bacterium]|nr:GNAT family N-acetyltransferase [Spirochaetota bacterium]